MSHHRDCAIALLNKLGISLPQPEYIYCAPHGHGMRDIAGMFDVDCWLPQLKMNIRIACSAHAHKKGTIDEHNLTNVLKYIPHYPCFSYYLVTWRVVKHKLTFRFYKLPTLEEI